MSGKTLTMVFAVLAGLFWLIGAYAPAAFLGHFTVFVLACFIGYMVVWNVTPALHTPLMSVTNAISSIIAIGALVQIAPPETGTAGRPDGLIPWLAFAALGADAPSTCLAALPSRAACWPCSASKKSNKKETSKCPKVLQPWPTWVRPFFLS